MLIGSKDGGGIDSGLKELYARGRFAEVVVAVDSLSDPAPEQRAFRAQSLYMLGDFRAALPDYAAVLRVHSTQTNFEYFQRARTSVFKSGMSPDEAEVFWRSCSDPVSLEAGALFKKITSGEFREATTDFSRLAERIFACDETRAAWCSAFDLLVRAVQGGPIPCAEPVPGRSIVMVSGAGWSGSGAIYDYLRGHAEVHPVLGESSALEGSGGFRAFVELSDSREACARHAAEFFFQNMLGFFPMKTPDSFKELRTARNNSTDPQTGRVYASGIKPVVHAMAEVIQAADHYHGERDAALRSLCDAIINHMITFMVPPGKLALLDNCIHTQHIALARYLSSTVIICCCRDPRTNYLALRNEFPGFSHTAASYAEETRRHREAFRRDVTDELQEEIRQHSSRGEIVGFEEFVVSDARRAKIDEILGLPESEKSRFQYFRPWESFRNTQLHLDCDRPDDVAEIYRAVREYCVELTVTPSPIG